MSQLSSRLKKVGIALGTGAYGDASLLFTYGLLASQLSVNPKTEVKGVPEVRGDFSTRRVTTKAGLDHDLTLSHALDMGDNSSGNVGYFLAGIMGVDTVSGAGPSYLHTFTRQDDSEPAWFNLYSDKDPAAKQYLGFRPNSVKFTLKAGDGLIPVDVGGVIKGESLLAAAQTLAFSGSPVVAPQQATLLIGGVAPCFDELSITITRDVQRYRCIGASRLISNAYTKMFQIQFDAKGLTFANDTVRNLFLNGTSSSLSLILTDANGLTLTFSLPEIYYQTFDGPDVKDTDLLTISLSGIATGNGYSVALLNARQFSYLLSF